MKHAFLWPLWPFLDPHTGRPSASKCMAWAILALTAAGRPIPVTLAALLLATAFGYSMFKTALGKTTLGLTGSDAVALSYKNEHTVNETVARTISERRDRENGTEAAP